MSEINWKSFGNFTIFFSRLIQIDEKNDVILLSQLKDELNATVEVADKKWLIE